MTPNYDISIQIINYNTKAYLSNCLSDILRDLNGSTIKYCINILDNNSKDDLSDLENRFSESNVHFFYSNQNLGFGGGHNYLAGKTDSKFLIILNSDLRFIEQNTIPRLYDVMRSNPAIKLIGPKLVTDKGQAQLFDHGELKGLTAWIALHAGDSYWRDRVTECEVAWVSGAFFLVDSETFKKLAGFDEHFFLYKEEEDLCLRLRGTGSKIIYYPAVSVMHYGSVVAKKSTYLEKSTNYFLEKNFKNLLFASLCRLLYTEMKDLNRLLKLK